MADVAWLASLDHGHQVAGQSTGPCDEVREARMFGANEAPDQTDRDRRDDDIADIAVNHLQLTKYGQIGDDAQDERPVKQSNDGIPDLGALGRHRRGWDDRPFPCHHGCLGHRTQSSLFWTTVPVTGLK